MKANIQTCFSHSMRVEKMIGEANSNHSSVHLSICVGLSRLFMSCVPHQVRIDGCAHCYCSKDGVWNTTPPPTHTPTHHRSLKSFTTSEDAGDPRRWLTLWTSYTGLWGNKMRWEQKRSNYWTLWPPTILSHHHCNKNTKLQSQHSITACYMFSSSWFVAAIKRRWRRTHPSLRSTFSTRCLQFVLQFLDQHLWLSWLLVSLSKLAWWPYCPISSIAFFPYQTEEPGHGFPTNCSNCIHDLLKLNNAAVICYKLQDYFLWNSYKELLTEFSTRFYLITNTRTDTLLKLLLDFPATNNHLWHYIPLILHLREMWGCRSLLSVDSTRQFPTMHIFYSDTRWHHLKKTVR